LSLDLQQPAQEHPGDIFLQPCGENMTVESLTAEASSMQQDMFLISAKFCKILEPATQ
jgi:hypothetical protein